MVLDDINVLRDCMVRQAVLLQKRNQFIQILEKCIKFFIENLHLFPWLMNWMDMKC